jgi:hypothetical protein
LHQKLVGSIIKLLRDPLSVQPKAARSMTVLMMVMLVSEKLYLTPEEVWKQSELEDERVL